MKYIRQNHFGLRYVWESRISGSRCVNQRDAKMDDIEAGRFAIMEREKMAERVYGNSTFIIEGLPA